MALDNQYKLFHVSKTEDILASAQRYKNLRLRALQLSPSSFASTYETEATFNDEYWVSDLLQDGKETFICAATTPSETNPDSLEWVAQVTFSGPKSRENFTLPPESGQPDPASDEEEERWQMLGLFTLPAHQGKGIAKALYRAGLDYVMSYRSHPPNVRVRLMVKPGLHDVWRMYKNLGFQDAGRGTLAEAFKANGMEDHLPEGFESNEAFCARTSYIMMQVFPRIRN
ncbi:putative GNAT family acetyltransferase [Aspergillus steynii IBT 23096]|uniref:Putative GNAT family acetyltransferase n=1 Tax=Aspergillus steynii IBT 23096 TaxID=1392250 RepID=A0A2I2G9Y7_9EURO|nr:putative GNAT family acetyltransferase [Aspergillus steynii IBT 23096]PLB49678.1 putative GNAT family acetyltransferase [Aspergillus steynii IBT 23096]